MKHTTSSATGATRVVPRALRSLTFVPYNDEHSADLYAADIAGNDTLAPFGKLEIANGEQRIEDLSRSGRNLHSGTFF